MVLYQPFSLLIQNKFTLDRFVRKVYLVLVFFFLLTAKTVAKAIISFFRKSLKKTTSRLTNIQAICRFFFMIF